MNNDDMYSDDSLKNARVSKWYDELANSVTKCVFCDLREKYVIYDNETSILTMSLFPYIDGQLLVLPKRHIENMSEISKSEWSDFKELIDLGIKLIRNTLNINTTNILYREGGKGSGKSVGHLHMHILPITDDFMLYDKGVGFTWKFQTINNSPLEMAQKYRECLATF